MRRNNRRRRRRQKPVERFQEVRMDGKPISLNEDIKNVYLDYEEGLSLIVSSYNEEGLLEFEVRYTYHQEKDLNKIKAMIPKMIKEVQDFVEFEGENVGGTYYIDEIRIERDSADFIGLEYGESLEDRKEDH